MSDQSTNGETDLNKLLAEMTPQLDEQIWVFLSLKARDTALEDKALMRFDEEEGATYILKEADAKGYDATFRCQRITLQIHSALEAVGFLDAISTALTLNGISSNVVSAFYHDHLFVPVEKTAQTMFVLKALSASARE
jgi:hypothetical protein